jgi:hypothetical protein
LANTAALIRHAMPRRVADLNGDKVSIPLLPSSILGFNINEPQLRLTKSESNLKGSPSSISSSISSSMSPRRFKRITGLFRKRGTDASSSIAEESIEEEREVVESVTLHERTPVDTHATASDSVPQFVVDPPTPPSPSKEVNDVRRNSGAGSLRIFTALKK